jgi:hypothetical protein
LYPCGFARGERVCLPAQSALLAAFRSRHQFLGSQIWAPCDIFMVLVHEGRGEEQASSTLVNSFFKSSPLICSLVQHCSFCFSCEKLVSVLAFCLHCLIFPRGLSPSHTQLAAVLVAHSISVPIARFEGFSRSGSEQLDSCVLAYAAA